MLWQWSWSLRRSANWRHKNRELQRNSFLPYHPLSMRSKVWSILKKDHSRVLCTLCNKRISRPKDGGTGALKRHIRLLHPTEYNRLFAEHPKKQQPCRSLVKPPIISTTSDRIHVETDIQEVWYYYNNVSIKS